MILIIGLGNPGKQYQNNRHNIGFKIIDQVQTEFDLPKFITDKKLLAEISKKQNIILAKPLTYMNNSGQAVQLIKKYYQLKLSEIIIIHDDLDLKLGKIRISKNSSSGGNQGVNSIIKYLKSKNFIRLRIGIANELRKKIPAEKFVLQNFTKAENQELIKVSEQCLEIIKEFSNHKPLAQIQNQFN